MLRYNELVRYTAVQRLANLGLLKSSTYKLKVSRVNTHLKIHVCDQYMYLQPANADMILFPAIAFQQRQATAGKMSAFAG